MDCSVARILIRRGAVPGAGPGRVPQLGFHLASCSKCREYMATLPSPPRAKPPPARSAPQIVQERQPPETLAAAPMEPGVPVPAPRLFGHRWARGVVQAMLLITMIVAWYLGLPLARALADIAAMSGAKAVTPHAQPPPAKAEIGGSSPLLAVAVVPTNSFTKEPTATVVPPAPRPGAQIAEPSPSAAPKSVQFVRHADIPPVEFDKEATPAPSPFPTATSTATSVALPTETVLPTGAPTEAPSPTGAPSPSPQPPAAAASGTTLLLLGIDARPGEGWVARSDAIIVVRLEPEHNRIAALSLPRDLWVAIPGAGETRINNAYFWGEQAGNGIALAKQTVGDALGIPIDYAVVIDFDGFRGVIDTLGGVPVEVPRELYDPQFPTVDYGYTVAHFAPGAQTLDGERALTFSRIRHPDSDFERMRRQQLVLLGIARRFRERGALETLETADQLTAALRPFVRSDIPFPLALNLLWNMRSIDPNVAQRLTVDLSVVSEANIGGGYALIAGDGVLRSVGAQLLASP